VTIIVCWIVFPVLLALLSLGAGLLVETVSGTRLPGALLPPVGLALLVVVAGFATLADATAELTAPAVVTVSIAGFVASRAWRRGRPDPWVVAAAGASFALFAAPIVLSGEATFAGYIKLDDTATWLAMTDRVMEHGRSLDGLAHSTYRETLSHYLSTAYPVGSFLPLGLGSKLVGQDPAWLFQPYLALLATMMALSLYVVIQPLVSSRPARAVIVAVAAQAALLYGFSLWGGIKELAAAWIVALVPALVPPVLRGEGGRGALVPLAVVGAAGVGILSFGGVVWLAPALVVSLVVLLWVRGPAETLAPAGFFGVVAAVLAIPSLVYAKEFLEPALDGVLTSQEELGNLAEPLSWLQFFGIWPAGDFRLDPKELDATYVLIAVVVGAAAVGLGWSWRRRSWGLPLYVLAAAAGCVIVAAFGAPWVDAKALATASPAFLVAALTGTFAIYARGRRVEAFVAAAAVAGGVLWSSALAFHEVSLAPRDRLAELEQIGERFAGQGPALMTEYEPYGARHFLRDLDAEGASELRWRVIPLRTGRPLQKLGSADIDRFRLDAVLVYRTLVLRRSPVGSRPPSVYRLVWRGRYYDVWQRPEQAPRVADHLPLGDDRQPASDPGCAVITRFWRKAPSGARLAAIARPETTFVEIRRTVLPSGWRPDSASPGVFFPSGPGTVEGSVALPRAARYGVWLGGAFRGRVELAIDGRPAHATRHELSHGGHWVPMGALTLEPGLHRFRLSYEEGDLHPGSGGQPFPLGPLALTPETINGRVMYVPAKEARRLCGKRLDWVEAVSAR
jgi:hypothetical protein